MKSKVFDSCRTRQVIFFCSNLLVIINAHQLASHFLFSELEMMIVIVDTNGSFVFFLSSFACCWGQLENEEVQSILVRCHCFQLELCQ